ncbi:MAG: ROK family transcriptional regulator [Bacteroidales bacterium]|nr:ROK family transcriptional regulator [Bacteroidales bacterium]
MRNTFLDKKDNKNSLLKKTILHLCIQNGEYSIASLSEQINSSVPTVTKLIGELMDEGFMIELGKSGTSGGRRPSIYGLNPDAGMFVGLDIRHSHASIAVTDFKGGLISFQDNIPFTFEPDENCIHRVAHSLRAFFSEKDLDWNKVLGMGISVAGRVNPKTGYSNLYSFDPERPINKILSEDLDIPVVIENDSRAMTYGEYLAGAVKKEKNVLFINVSWGLGMGMILDGHLYYGTSGFSGEFGHFPLLDNDQICRCGKIGCLETGASGSALVRLITEQLRAGRASSLSQTFKKEGKVNLNDIFKAIQEEDILTIESIEKIGSNLGRGLAGLINVFNPQLVVIGGKLSLAGDYLILPIRSAVKRHAQTIANQDTAIRFTKLRNEAAPIGACMLSRSHLLGIV